MKDSTLFQFLSAQYSIDYWSDVALGEAIEIANSVQPTEWATIRATWKEAPEYVQVRLAEVACELTIDNPDAVLMLVDMLSCTSCEVVEASLDALNSLSQNSPDRLCAADVEKALDKVRPSGDISSLILESLKQNLKRYHTN